MNKWIVCLSLSLLAVSFSYSEETLKTQPGSSLTLNGDSTLHKFSSKTTTFNLDATTDDSKPPFTTILQKNGLKKFKLSIPVEAIKSKESGLDKNMYKALKTSTCPDITLQLNSYTVTPSTTVTGASHATVQANLNIACQEKPITLEVLLTPKTNTLQVDGEYGLKMTEYGVTPPKLMMGTIKVKDPVVIQFSLLLAQ